jgi:hypothetical protein
MHTIVQNLKNTIAEHGATISEDQTGPRALVLPNGQAIAFGWPASTSDDAPQLLAGARVAALLAKTHGEIRRIESDPDRSPAYKEKEVAKAIERGAAEFAVAREAAEAMIASFDTADRAEAVPPALAATDGLNIALDREVRDWVRGLTAAEQAKLAQELLDGTQPRALAALLRSPIKVDGVLGQTIGPAWVDAVAKADPTVARQRAHARALNESLRMVAAHAAGSMPTLPKQGAMGDAIYAAAQELTSRRA